jgi:predicted GNAT family N-acyltransferase
MSTEPTFLVTEVAWTDASGRLGAVRRRVFVREQEVPEELEWDGLDGDCRHVLATDPDGVAIGTGRLLPDGHIGRMAVIKQWRGKGVGRALLAKLVELARDRGDRVVALNAQTHAIGFYRSGGFDVSSAEFMEAGIPHVEMRLRLRAD